MRKNSLVDHVRFLGLVPTFYDSVTYSYKHFVENQLKIGEAARVLLENIQALMWQVSYW